MTIGSGASSCIFFICCLCLRTSWAVDMKTGTTFADCSSVPHRVRYKCFASQLLQVIPPYHSQTILGLEHKISPHGSPDCGTVFFLVDVVSNGLSLPTLHTVLVVIDSANAFQCFAVYENCGYLRLMVSKNIYR